MKVSQHEFFSHICVIL